MDIFEATKKGIKTTISELLKSGIKINCQDKNGMTPLMISIDNRNIEIVKFILGNRPNLDIVAKYNQTALMLAAGRGNIGIVKAILICKPNKKLKSKSGLTAYDFAYENGHYEIAKLIGN